MLRAPIADIFSSRQGEGLYCGQKQIFIRFAGCNLNCYYCDEPAARLKRRARRLALREILAQTDALRKTSKAKAVSLTGGEPLLHAGFLNRLIPALKRRGLAVHLETNGTLPQAYARLKRKPDVVAADLKLPSATGRSCWRRHEQFLKLCRGRVFVKTVLDARSTPEEAARAIEAVASVDRAMPFFWQPATPSKRTGAKSAQAARIRQAARLAARHLRNVRVLRQMHVLWGIK